MEIKAKDMCPRCKYCLGMTPQGMYSCGKANDGSELNIGIDVVLNCANFEWKEGKVSDICPKCKSKNITRIRRVSGYLEILDGFTKGKKNEV